MGYDVTGTDLSVNSISEASKHENDSLHFIVHDMREEFRKDHFDAVFNLFTSIGYFRDSKDNFSVFRHVSTALKPGAVFVIDFFNAEKVCEALKPEYIEKRGEIQFCIRKIIRDNSVIKHIEFSDKGHNYYFEESVSLLRKKDFEGFASAAGLKPGGIFGNYQLQPFNEKESDRLILIFKK
jgi:SAM-dependent methyltransferase